MWGKLCLKLHGYGWIIFRVYIRFVWFNQLETRLRSTFGSNDKNKYISHTSFNTELWGVIEWKLWPRARKWGITECFVEYVASCNINVPQEDTVSKNIRLQSYSYAFKRLALAFGCLIDHAWPSICLSALFVYQRGFLIYWLSFVMFYVTSPYGILGRVWYIIKSIPDLCHLSYFQSMCAGAR